MAEYESDDNDDVIAINDLSKSMDKVKNTLQNMSQQTSDAEEAPPPLSPEVVQTLSSQPSQTSFPNAPRRVSSGANSSQTTAIKKSADAEGQLV